jgi:D-beta-D-heptose 7-phosphate kinase/D-beta-D-heptose 1-phosphate adenosyltransferase
METIVLVTGGFDPLHSGHIEYFKAAKKLGDKLVVGLNSDEWLTRKKGRPFMPFHERLALITEMAIVDDVISFDDSDNSACGAIYKTLATNESVHIIFANGGDRTDANIPEMTTYADAHNVEFVFGIGGENKANSSSWILDEWKTQKTERDWGYWRVLDDKPEKGYKVKELVIYPGKSLSDQRHFIRSEQWNILEGEVKMTTEWDGRQEITYLKPGNMPYEIAKEVWHLPSNPGETNAHVLEIQRGEKCIEEDIERR